MGEYTVEFTSTAAKELRRLPLGIKIRIEEAIESLALQPRRQSVVKLKGFVHTYRIRVGDHRVVFEISDKNRVILVTKVRHRREVYV